MSKLDEDKTELIVFASKNRVKDLSGLHLNFGGNIVSDAECFKSLGIYFEKTLAIDKQISAVSKSCFNQIRNIGRIRPFITDEACETLCTRRHRSTIKNSVTNYKPMQALRSENAMIFTTPNVRTKTYGERRFDKAAAVLWNDLPSELGNIHSVNVF
ncbi:unnamed protein product [Mytilus coruscus]|uniref:Uncharacterized protein n=1 Tax=Mytilus coruscus TaxID=42192 RepID=A0A6J8DPX6_MYTCO|nr:unnamed protein product [Mytilus coruscus]